MLVYSGVYFLIECTPRYAYTAQIFLALMSAYTIDYIIIHRNHNKKRISPEQKKKSKSVKNKRKMLNLFKKEKKAKIVSKAN